MLIFQSVKNHDDHQLNIAENSMISANSKSSSVKYHHDENALMIDQKIRANIYQIRPLLRYVAVKVLPYELYASVNYGYCPYCTSSPSSRLRRLDSKGKINRTLFSSLDSLSLGLNCLLELPKNTWHVWLQFRHSANVERYRGSQGGNVIRSCPSSRGFFCWIEVRSIC